MNTSRAAEFLRERRERDIRSVKQPSFPARPLSPSLGASGMKKEPALLSSTTRPTLPGPGKKQLLKDSTAPPPPRPSSSEEDSTAPPPRPPSWLMLDRFVHRSRRYGVVDSDATASNPAEDCVGRPISASLRIAASPAVSRLYLHWPGRPSIEGMREPAVIAAHAHSILFKVYVPFRDPHLHSHCFFPLDYFVYSASSSPPQLTRLPVCKDGVETEPDDRFFEPHRRQQQRVMLDRNMGLLCHGQPGEFTVADLTHRFHHEVELCVLHHRPRRTVMIGGKEMTEIRLQPRTVRVDGKDITEKRLNTDTLLGDQWNVERLQIPPDMAMRGLDLTTFEADAVIPIRRWFLAWVDYYQGMLLVDVLHAHDDPKLRFIPLPAETLQSHRFYYDEGCPDPARCVSITDSGTIKLVCIIIGTSPSFTIVTWTLADMNKGVWEKDGTAMEDSQFWCIYAGHNLPRVQPSFPVVSLVDPDVICFLLKEVDNNNFWMIEVNMRNEVLQYSAIYINEEEEEGYSSKKTPRNFFHGHYFIPSKFSAYLDKDAITSQELSDMMQKKVIQRRATQKIGLESQPKK